MCFPSQFSSDHHGINIRPLKILIAALELQASEDKHSRKSTVGSNRKVIEMDKTVVVLNVPCFQDDKNPISDENPTAAAQTPPRKNTVLKGRVLILVPRTKANNASEW